MDTPKFVVGSLVRTDVEIYEILEMIPIRGGYSYRVELRAYLRDMSSSEWRNQLHPFQTTIGETKLTVFEHAKPKFKLADRVKLPYFTCLVRFIKFENHHYIYHVMDENNTDFLQNGWVVEEDCLSK